MKKADLLTKTRTELLKLAHRLGLRGISTLNKPDLAAQIRRAQQARSVKTLRQPLGVAVAAHKLTNELKRRAIRKRAKAAAARAAGKPVAPARKTKAVKPLKVAAMSAAKQVPVATSAAAKELAAHKFDVAPKPDTTEAGVYRGQPGRLAGGVRNGTVVPRGARSTLVVRVLGFELAADGGLRADRPWMGGWCCAYLRKTTRNQIQELTLHHDSRNWYIHVGKAATTYSAQLGYWQHGGGFHVIGQSRETTTPSAAVSPDTMARFVTIPLEFSFRDLMNLIRGHVRDGERLADCASPSGAGGFPVPIQGRGGARAVDGGTGGGIGTVAWRGPMAAHPDGVVRNQRVVAAAIAGTTWFGIYPAAEWLSGRACQLNSGRIIRCHKDMSRSSCTRTCLSCAIPSTRSFSKRTGSTRRSRRPTSRSSR